MAANLCNAFKVMDDPWYSVHCSLKMGHGGRHEHHWNDADESHRSLKPSRKGVERGP